MTESPPEAAGRWDLLKSIRSRQSVTVAGDNPAKKHSEQWNKEIVKVGSEFLKDVLWWKLIKTEKTPPSFTLIIHSSIETDSTWILREMKLTVQQNKC